MKAPRIDLMRKMGNCYADEAFPNLEKNMCEMVLSNGSFSLIDLLDYIVEFTGKASMDISTWIASYASIKHVEEFLEENKINSFRFIFDSGILRTRKDFIHKVLKDHGDIIAITSNHSKVTCIYNDKYNFVIETSANLNKNNRLENFKVIENKEYCDFYRSVFDEIFELKSQGNLQQRNINAIFR